MDRNRRLLSAKFKCIDSHSIYQTDFERIDELEDAICTTTGVVKLSEKLCPDNEDESSKRVPVGNRTDDSGCRCCREKPKKNRN